MNKTPHSILSNTLYLNISTVAARALGLITSIILARHLGKTSFGQLTLFFSIATITTTLSDIGILPYVIREVARDRSRSLEWFKTAFITKSYILIPIIIISSLITASLPIAYETKIVIIASLLYSGGRSYLSISDSFFSAWEKLAFPALWELLFPAMVLVFTLSLMYTSALRLNTVLAIYNAAIFVLFIISLWQLITRLFPVTSGFPKPQWHILKQSYHFLLASGAIIVLSQADILLLRAIHGPAATGYYGVGIAIFSGLLFFIANMSKVLFPTFSRLRSESSAQLSGYINKIFWMIYVFVLPLTAGGAILSERLILLVYGKEYLPASSSLQFLLFAFALQFFASFFIVLLQSSHFHKEVSKTSWLITAITIPAGFMLIYFFSYKGAAITRLLGNFLLMLLHWLTVRKKVLSIGMDFKFIKPVISTAAMAAFLVILYNTSLIILIPGAAAVYTISMLLLKGLQPEEYRFFTSFIRGTN